MSLVQSETENLGRRKQIDVQLRHVFRQDRFFIPRDMVLVIAFLHDCVLSKGSSSQRTDLW